jgi:hypothetical protein
VRAFKKALRSLDYSPACPAYRRQAQAGIPKNDFRDFYAFSEISS